MYHTYNWVIVEVTYEGETYYKLLSQVGIGLNDWRINSGIAKIEEVGNDLLIYGSSGSCYVCDKAEEGVSRTTQHVLDKIGDVEHKVILAKDILTKHLLKPN